MKIRDKVKVSDMGMLGLETFIGEICEIIDKKYFTIDFGEDTFLGGQYQIIHKERVQKYEK
tara:strand:+ start:333 stop:515 length:183 start_codon:yes stop_codon:yes gene_type:complete